MPASMSRLIRMFFADRTRSMLMVVCLIVSGLGVAFGPIVLSRATDVLVDGLRRDGIQWSPFMLWLVFALGIYGVQFLSKWIAGWLSTRMVSDIAYELRNRIETKIWKLPLNYYDSKSLGDILSRTTNDINNVVLMLNQTGGDLLYYLLMLVGILAMMVTLSWHLALVTVVLIPLSAFLVHCITSISAPQFRRQWDVTGIVNSLVEESFNGQTVIKSFGLESRFEERFEEHNADLYRASFKALGFSNLIQPCSRFLTNLNYVIVALVGAMRVVSGTMSIGDVQAFIQYARQFSQPFTSLAQMTSAIQSGNASLRRVFELLDAEEEHPDSTHAMRERSLSGSVEFRDVSFSYVPDKPLIEHLNLKVEAGQTVAIVGSTGAGKTTLVNLIERFYEVNSGEIVFDDAIEIHDLTRHALRRNISMVLQDTWLRQGTIRDNISYGAPQIADVSHVRFVRACKAAFVDDFVDTLPLGFGTEITNEGTVVSAGEKQLLTIARAFLPQSNILILDEATSSVDTRTEALIQSAIDSLREGRTSFVIAHRLSTIRGADIILVMERGHIVEQGSHEELLARNGTYAALYASQFDHADQ
ncbi:MAG: ABC transporter ATP-binding protein [Bifidobacterium sp.]|uniref:Fatty acid ABC transporter ATP-binding/permease protein n=1 Tax=Bifidobacterium fermentum TaxID=3059035 RepID=A0AB39UQK0_9BIFI